MHITHNSVTYFLYGDVSGALMWLLVAPHIIACPLQSRKCGYAPGYTYAVTVNIDGLGEFGEFGEYFKSIRQVAARYTFVERSEGCRSLTLSGFNDRQRSVGIAHFLVLFEFVEAFTVIDGVLEHCVLSTSH